MSRDMNESSSRSPLRRLAGVAAIAAGLSCAPAVRTPANTATVPPPVAVSMAAPLTSAQRQWVDRTLSSLTLRERVAQMVTVWTLGDYTNTRDTMYAQLIKWVEQ